MRTIWLRFGVSFGLFAVACSDDMGDPFAGTFTGAEHGDGSATVSTSGSGTTGANDTSADGSVDPTTASTSGESSSDEGPATTTDAQTGPVGDTGTDDESSTTETIVCIDRGECQPCVDCTVQPGGECTDEGLACQGDAECNALAACYNTCATMFMGDELEACVDTCYADHPDGVAPFEAAYGCFIAECGDLCPTEFGPLD